MDPWARGSDDGEGSSSGASDSEAQAGSHSTSSDGIAARSLKQEFASGSLQGSKAPTAALPWVAHPAAQAAACLASRLLLLLPAGAALWLALELLVPLLGT